MRKIIFLSILLCVTIFNVIAQNNQLATAADRAFEQGNYKDAIEIYKGAIEAEKNTSAEKKLRSRMYQAKTCIDHLAKANSLYSRERYAEAASILKDLLNINPSDTQARKVYNQAQVHANSIKLEKSLTKKLNDLLVSNNIKELKQFVNKNPNYSQTGIIKDLLIYYEDSVQFNIQSTEKKSEQYMNFANLYIENNKSTAIRFYEKAAANGFLLGFYHLAITLPDTEKNRIQRLLVFAAANGVDDAAKIFESKYPNLVYNKEIPKVIYQDLIKANQGNIFSKVVAQQYKFIIGLPSLNLIDDKSQYVSSEDHWQYELGLLYIKGYYVTKDSDKGFSYLFDAAAKGNYDAQERVADMLKASDEAEAIRLCAAINGSVEAQKQLGMNDRELRYARAYIQYLKKEQCKFHDVYLFLNFYAYKYHCEDIDAKLMTYAFSYYDGKTYKEVISLLKSKKIWNRETIMTIQNKLADSNKKSDKKLLKQLAKISVTVEKNKPNLLQSLIAEGFCTNPHPAVKIPLYDYMTYKVNSYESTPSNQTTPSRANTKERENKPSDTYYKIAPRRNMSIGEAQGWSSRLGAGWRLATASEMKNIPGLNGVFWTDGGNRGILIDSNDKFRSRYSNNPNDRAGAVAIKK